MNPKPLLDEPFAGVGIQLLLKIFKCVNDICEESAGLGI